MTVHGADSVVHYMGLPETTSDVVVMKGMQNLAGCGGVVISLLHYISQYTTVLLLSNDFLDVLNHLTGSRLWQLCVTQGSPQSSYVCSNVHLNSS